MPAFTITDGQVQKIGLWHGTVIKMGPGPEAGKRFKVTKINPVNVKLMDEDGRDGFTLNRAYAERHIDENQDWDGPKEKSEYEKLVGAAESGITLGTVVKLTSARLAQYNAKYVCVATRSDGTFRLAKLGGDNGRYLRGITVDEMEIVTV